ncbi:hypothetical protein N7539_003001 [Penicillium diatomitis]|uniref:Uncharacterized protein n=1 Tax=Penicillium diatomitis TaxID=2819901 RepID=A0A9W9XFV1_9EURO|nr:uncharacterized protein N7539_003001 [Penicillium diatomitis]KAJ5491434.1 hypothetical protein N7539_003001 [Penicillium diatomitis]
MVPKIEKIPPHRTHTTTQSPTSGRISLGWWVNWRGDCQLETGNLEKYTQLYRPPDTIQFCSVAFAAVRIAYTLPLVLAPHSLVPVLRVGRAGARSVGA